MSIDYSIESCINHNYLGRKDKLNQDSNSIQLYSSNNQVNCIISSKH